MIVSCAVLMVVSYKCYSECSLLCDTDDRLLCYAVLMVVSYKCYSECSLLCDTDDRLLCYADGSRLQVLFLM